MRPKKLLKAFKELFFLSVNKTLLKKKRKKQEKNQIPWYTGCVQGKQKSTQNYINLQNLKQRHVKTTQSSPPFKQETRKMCFNSMIEHSSPLKILLFSSHHMFHIIKCGITSQADADLCHPTPLNQQASSSNTCLGITQEIPNKLNKKDHKSETKGQRINRWSTHSQSFLHIQHLLTTQTLN